VPVRSLSGKICFVTGAASGIGRATALAAAREGAHLWLTDIDAAGLDAVVQQVRSAGGSVRGARALDLAALDAVRAFADEVHARDGSVDVVMNIAGIAVWGAVQNLAPSDWRRAVEVNLMGPIHVIHCFVPEMVRAGRGGHLVNVSSAAGLIGLPWHAPYSASKFGLRGVSEVLRFDLHRYGIGVSLVCPGGVDTGLVQTVQVAGVDTSNPAFDALRARFRRHAVTPDVAARCILRGIRRNRYLVFTSFDVQFGHWGQRWFPGLYALVMRRLNRHAVELLEAGGAAGGGKA
jgi:NAD(P)-dependent dehydrogenase (short-subunit alcohol dehydrogenase family)